MANAHLGGELLQDVVHGSLAGRLLLLLRLSLLLAAGCDVMLGGCVPVAKEEI